MEAMNGNGKLRVTQVAADAGVGEVVVWRDIRKGRLATLRGPRGTKVRPADAAAYIHHGLRRLQRWEPTAA
jgi:hypothetical protein